MYIRTLSLLYLIAIHVAFGQLAFTGPHSFAGDWPQILGPQRNGIAVDERIRTNWGREQPRLVWEYAVGQGYAGPAVAGEKVIILWALCTSA